MFKKLVSVFLVAVFLTSNCFSATLEVSANGRYLEEDGEPFLWIGDTAWPAGQRTLYENWVTLVDDRAEKTYNVIQLAPVVDWPSAPWDSPNVYGNKAFLNSDIKQFNEPYWSRIDALVDYANSKGIWIHLNGMAQPYFEPAYPNLNDAKTYAEMVANRYKDKMVTFSPSFDSDFRQDNVTISAAIKVVAPNILVTEHPNVPYHPVTNTGAMLYQASVDFKGNQSGYADYLPQYYIRNAWDWNLALYNGSPTKPVINLEMFYENNGTYTEPERFIDAERTVALGVISVFAGARGFTHGVRGIWTWVTDPTKPEYWENALNWPGSEMVGDVATWLRSIDWWLLEPYTLSNQPSDWTKKSFASKLGTKLYVISPANEAVQTISNYENPNIVHQIGIKYSIREYTEIAGQQPIVFSGSAYYAKSAQFTVSGTSIYSNWSNNWVEYAAPAAGAYTLELITKNKGSLPAPPGFAYQIQVKANGTTIKTINVPATVSPATFSTSLTVPATSAIRFNWVNDAYQAGVYDANLQIDQVSFTLVPPPPPPPC